MLKSALRVYCKSISVWDPWVARTIDSMLFFISSMLLKNNTVIFQFADAVNRIECYREMLLSQTSMLGVQPLADISKYIKKAKVSRI